MGNPFKAEFHAGAALVEAAKLPVDPRHLALGRRAARDGDWAGAVADAKPFVDEATSILRSRRCKVGNPFKAVFHAGAAVVEAGKLTADLRHVRDVMRDARDGDWAGAVADAQPFIDEALRRIRVHHARLADALAEIERAYGQFDAGGA